MNAMPTELTDRQQQILDFIRERVEAHGSTPSLREIMAQFGFTSPATVTSHLTLLEKKGAIRREPGRSRNIVLPDRENRPHLREIPVFGLIPAGLPADQVQEPDRQIAVDADFLQLSRNAKTFALEVRGDSMRDAGILDRDVVILEVALPRHRDIVAALIDGETTLKRYLVQDGQPFLHAENPDYPDLVPARELVIQGVFRALIRTQPS